MLKKLITITLFSLMALFAAPTVNAEVLDLEKEVAKVKILAEQGDAGAQTLLGDMYLLGKGMSMTQDHREALKWYRKAAKQGDADAQYNLGDMYRDGTGVTQDHEEAYFWFNLAAAQNEMFAVVRDLAYQELTPQQRERAQKRAREWRPISPE